MHSKPFLIIIFISSIFILTLCTHNEKIRKYRFENTIQANEIRAGFSIPEYEKFFAKILPSIPSPDPIFIPLVGGPLKIDINGDEALAKMRLSLQKIQNEAQIPHIVIESAESVVHPQKESISLIFTFTSKSLYDLKNVQKELTKNPAIKNSLVKIKIPLIEVAVDPMMDHNSLKKLVEQTNKILDESSEIDKTFTIDWDIQ